VVFNFKPIASKNISSSHLLLPELPLHSLPNHSVGSVECHSADLPFCVSRPQTKSFSIGHELKDVEWTRPVRDSKDQGTFSGMQHVLETQRNQLFVPWSPELWDGTGHECSYLIEVRKMPKLAQGLNSVDHVTNVRQ